MRLLAWAEALFLAGVLAQAALARLAGMRVELVSIGFGPPLLRFGRFQLAAYPLGGFNRIAGLHATATPVDTGDRAAYFNRPWPWRALVVLGYFIGAQLLVVIGSAAGTVVLGVRGKTAVLEGIFSNTPAEAAGMQVGDEVLAVDGVPLGDVDELDRRVQDSRGATLSLDVRRGTERLTVPVTPWRSGSRFWIIGTLLTPGVEHPPTLTALVHGAAAPFVAPRAAFATLVELAAGRRREVVGPEGMVNFLNTMRPPIEQWAIEVAMASYAALCLLIPLPPLGGQLLLVLAGWRSRRRRAPGVVAQDLGAVSQPPRRFPLALIAALLPLTISIVLEALAEPHDVYRPGAVVTLLFAVALANGLPRSWSWGVYLPLLSIPSLLALPTGTVEKLLAVAGALVVTLTLLLPPVRAWFGKICPACGRGAAAPVRSAPKMCCLACGSVYDLRLRLPTRATS